MVINIKNVRDILNAKLDMVQRGILITILLNKETDPKLTLAKCKASFNFTKHKSNLCYLHEFGFISWSKYFKAKESLSNVELEPDVIEIIDFMNNLYKRKFSPSSGKTKVNLLNRLSSNSVNDIKKVIANRYKVWKDEPMMSKYLQPSTIFKASNFDKYLEEANHTREGESFVNASRLSLENGTEITTYISNQLIETDTYNLKIFFTDEYGAKRGNGKNIVRYGKDIKRLINVQDINEKHNGLREYLYYYNTKI